LVKVEALDSFILFYRLNHTNSYFSGLDYIIVADT